MHEVERLALLAQLGEEFCELNHGPGTRREDFPASDYLVMPFGYKESEVCDVAVRELVVPVCHECAQALLGNEWTLLYCFECASSQWIYRPKAKMHYRHHVLWLKGCPDCGGKFGGLYFSDLEAVAAEADLLGKHIRTHAA